MAMGSTECKACGCHLDHGDVRQLALYYRQELPSMVAVQYVCPRCGASEWQQYDPAEWPGDPQGVAADWTSLVRDLGLPDPERDERAWLIDPKAIDLADPISVDEYIDFALRIETLTTDDTSAIRAACHRADSAV